MMIIGIVLSIIGLALAACVALALFTEHPASATGCIEEGEVW